MEGQGGVDPPWVHSPRAEWSVALISQVLPARAAARAYSRVWPAACGRPADDVARACKLVPSTPTRRRRRGDEGESAAVAIRRRRRRRGNGGRQKGPHYNGVQSAQFPEFFGAAFGLLATSHDAAGNVRGDGGGGDGGTPLASGALGARQAQYPRAVAHHYRLQ